MARVKQTARKSTGGPRKQLATPAARKQLATAARIGSFSDYERRLQEIRELKEQAQLQLDLVRDQVNSEILGEGAGLSSSINDEPYAQEEEAQQVAQALGTNINDKMTRQREVLQPLKVGSTEEPEPLGGGAPSRSRKYKQRITQKRKNRRNRTRKNQK